MGQALYGGFTLCGFSAVRLVPMRLDQDGVPEGYPLREGWKIAPGKLAEMRREGEGLVLLDCRTEREREIAQIEGSEFIPLSDLSDRAIDLEDHVNEKVVVYCHHGVRSLQAVALLRGQGFEDVMSLAGGIDLWSVAIDPLVPRY